MENFVGTEIFVQTVEYREFAGVDYAADGINDTAGQKPVKCLFVQQLYNIAKGKYTQPAHGNV